MEPSQKETAMKIQLKAFVISLMGIALLSGAVATSYAVDVWPGGACKAANLNQAKNLGWSQWGIDNPNPIGGASYWVLCNIGPKDATRDSTPQSYEIGMQYLNPAVTGGVTCIFRVIDPDRTPPLIVGSKISTVTPPFNGDSVTYPAESSWHHYTVTCLMPPQTRLTYISLNGY